MANPEHLDILRQGVSAWNEWYAQHPDVSPDFCGADLRSLDLRGARFNTEDAYQTLDFEAKRRYSRTRTSSGSGYVILSHRMEVKSHPTPLFDGADLRETDLSGGILNNASFCGALLAGTNLSQCKLIGAKFDLGAVLDGAIVDESDLGHCHIGNATSCCDTSFVGSSLIAARIWNAMLSNARFDRAVLNCAELSDTELPNASFVDAYLIEVHFRSVLFAGVDFQFTHFGNTILSNVDFSRSQHLETCIHHWPSVIDHGSIERSRPLPLAFLRGIGMPDDWVKSIPSLMSGEGRFHSVFISYSSRDADFVRRLHRDLLNAGVRCWFAPEDLRIGEQTRRAIHDAISVHDKLLIVLSEHSVQSAWVEDEVERALERERTHGKILLFPIRLDSRILETDQGWPATIRNTRNVGDFSGWDNDDIYRSAFTRLLRDLTANS